MTASRDAIVDALLAANTAAECRRALDAAEAWLDDHPDDHDVQMMMEQPATILDLIESNLIPDPG